jgi:hypothetical protein
MKLKCIGISIGIILMIAAACFGSTDGSSDTPLAVALEPVFQFEPVLDGEEVVHDFVIRNQGNAELIIYEVQTG